MSSKTPERGTPNEDDKKKGLARVPTPKISLKTETEVLKGD